MSVLLLQGNALKIPLADKKVHCVVTSPPYYGLRSYSGEQRLIWGGDENCAHEWITSSRYWDNRHASVLASGEEDKLGSKKDARGHIENTHCESCGALYGSLGLEPTLQDYINNTVLWCREVWRVLRDDGVFFLNLGDSYAGSGGGHAEHHENPGISRSNKRGGIPHYGKLGMPGRYSPEGFKPKDLMLVPHRAAIALQNDGWWVRSDIVWNKPNPMPESVKDRPTKSHEYIFLLTKSKNYYYDADAIRESHLQSSIERDKSGWNAAFKGRHTMPGEKRPHSTDKTGFLNPAGRNKRSVWTITTKPYKGAHFATFPPELPETCIRAGTSEHGCCPVCGSQWARVVEHENMIIRRSERTHSLGRTRSSGTMEKPASSKTIGWKPTCSCYDEVYRAFPRVKNRRKRHQQDTQNEWWKRAKKRPLDFTPCDRCKGTGIDPEDKLEMACYDCVGAGWVEVVTVPAVVADIFCGSATAIMVARQLGRVGIGIDLSWEYLQLARERTGERAWKEWIEGRKEANMEETLEELPLFSMQNK